MKTAQILIRVRSSVVDVATRKAMHANITAAGWARSMIQQVLEEDEFVRVCEKAAPRNGARISVRQHPEAKKDAVFRFSIPGDICELIETMARRNGWRAPVAYRAILDVAASEDWDVVELDHRLTLSTTRRTHLEARVPLAVWQPIEPLLPVSTIESLTRCRVALTAGWLRSTNSQVVERVGTSLLRMVEDMVPRWFDSDRIESEDIAFVHLAYRDPLSEVASIASNPLSRLPEGFNPPMLVSILATVAVLEWRQRLVKGV